MLKFNSFSQRNYYKNGFWKQKLHIWIAKAIFILKISVANAGQQQILRNFNRQMQNTSMSIFITVYIWNLLYACLYRFHNVLRQLWHEWKFIRKVCENTANSHIEVESLRF